MGLREDLVASFEELLARDAAAAAGLVETLRERVAASGSAERAASAEASHWHGLIGESAPMLDLRGYVEKFAKADAPVLITGESGTGKEVVAKAVHQLSPRRSRPFVAENCAAIPETLLESVLFGHKKGAFTGAVQDHPGHFVAAHRGTLMLDEIGEMALPMQAKLLRALQEGEVRAVGESRPRKVDVRVVAATNQDLERAVRDGRFREDLYFRLNVLRLLLPPLRDRGEDILLLARRFLADAAARAGRDLSLSAATEKALLGRAWRGNVRQLQNEMQRLAVLADGPRIEASDLTPGS